MRTSLPPNPLKQALHDNRRQIGLWLTLVSPTVTEVVAGAGFDWLLIDMEHTSNELPDVIHHLRAATGGTAEPVVRLPWNEPVLVKRLLDAGARSLMFPYVQSAEEARRAVAATRYPPAGIRGYAGGSRATGYGRIADYADQAANAICIIIQIESPDALEAIPEIACVDGVDGVFIGPNDLAANMGFLGKADAPEVRAAILSGLADIRRAGKAAGLLDYVESDARQMFEAGFCFLAVGGDSNIIARGSERLAQAFMNPPL